MTDALEQIRTRNAVTPQSEQADPRQARNNAGGWAFTVPGATRISRFLTIGVEGGTFYVKPRALVKDNAAVVLDWARNHGTELTVLATEISQAGRAPKNGPAIFALAATLALGDEQGAEAAARAVPLVVRTGTHLFTFCGYLEQFRGWGRKAQRAVASWYLQLDEEALAYQLVKYRQRHGWTHADVLRSAHPVPRLMARGEDGIPLPLGQRPLMAGHDRLFAWVAGRPYDGGLPKWAQAYEAARAAERSGGTADARTAKYVRLIGEYPGLPWEILPDEAMVQGDVLGALVDAGMPQHALITELPRLTRYGALPPMSARLRAVCDQIRDPGRLAKARVHPLAMLTALKTYALGYSLDGHARWAPAGMITDALSDGFYAAFPAVVPAGKRTVICTDCSGSMGWEIKDRTGRLIYPFRAAEIVGAMAMVVAATEPQWGVYGFASELFPLSISPRMRLDQVCQVMLASWGGSTDCAAPMLWAARNRIEVDTFQCWTDNETWYGAVHPHQALEQYRQVMGIDARLQVAAVVPTEFSIADPDDPRQLDVSGFDSAVPRLLADHSRGDL